MLSEAKHLPVRISFLAAPFMTTRPQRRVTFFGYATLAFISHHAFARRPARPRWNRLLRP
jgi:hypothetical protein